MKIIKTSFLFSAALLSSTFVYAAQIQEISVSSDKNPQQQVLNEMLYQVYDLLNEVSRLNGTVEEQAYQLNQIEIQNKQRYLDSDRRIVELTLKVAELEKKLQDIQLKPVQTSQVTAPILTTKPSELVIIQDGSEQYAKAIAYLQKQDYKNAEDAFEAFIEQYSNSERMPNATYWLGKVYLKLGDTKKANSMFFQTQQNYPKDPKAASSLLEMSDIAVQKNNTILAKKYLIRVMNEFAHDPTAQQAKIKLEGLNVQ
ncbi:tol-pal system protein YbgF [Marinicellulosiphila megalodicopiae]|uniref:tol-pal system protein YbgF n=1 Tax=Marinicellulosiphila megalodicopiae TaxID=2724896 RepID=UPI003BB0DBC9